MTVKLPTLQTLKDIEAACERIVRANGSNRELMQTVSVAALEHLKTNRNVAILKPVYRAAMSFSSKSLTGKWLGWCNKYASVKYNPDGLKGPALKNASFEQVFKFDKAAETDIDGARENKWFNFDMGEAPAKTSKVDVNDRVKSFTRTLQDLIDTGRLVGSDGKRVSLGTVKTLVKTALEGMTEKPVSKARPKPSKVAGKPLTEKVNEPRKRKAIKPMADQPITSQAAA